MTVAIPTPSYYAEVDLPSYVMGDTFEQLEITFTEILTEGASATPKDLSSATIKMEIRKNSTSAVVYTLSIGSGLAISGASSNVLLIGPFNLDQDSYGWHKYDVEVEIGGNKKTYFGGNFYIQPDITQNVA